MIVGINGGGATAAGAVAAAVATALQAKSIAAREAREQEQTGRRFMLRVLLLSSRARALSRSEIREILEAWGETGDQELEARLRDRLLEEFQDHRELPPA